MALKTLLFLAVANMSLVLGQFSGSASTNPRGGHDVNIAAGHRFGNPNHNLGAGVFASGSTNGGPVTTGAFADYNKNGHGLSLTHTNTPGFGSALSENARVNLFKDNTHKLDANAFHSRTNLDNGFKFDRVGGNLDYNHASGHGARLGASHIPQIGGTTMDLTGKANLWRSQDMRSTIDLTGTASRTFGGPFNRQTNFGAGLGLTHRF